MEVQNATNSEKTIAIIPSANNNRLIRSFDCSICYEPLTKPGPPLCCFTFGKLLINVSQLPFLERERIYREFCLVDQCLTNGRFDCDKIVSTICGHIFHSGCIREWFFMRRLERHLRCPFCNRRTNYEECIVLHPLSCNDLDDENDNDRMDDDHENQASEYSDISCNSSSWSSDEESNFSDGNDEGNVDLVDLDENERTSDEAMSSDNDDNDDLVEENFPNDNDHVGNVVQGLREESNNFLFPSDEPFYSPMYIGSRTSRNGMKNGGILYKMLDLIGKFSILHLVTLFNILKGVPILFHIKKTIFSQVITLTEDQIEDEKLADIDYEALVPLGYDFLGTMLIAGLFIITGEVYADIFKKKLENTRAISSRVMMLHYFTFDIFAIICLMITHDVLFY